jgi:formylglycine-generating enzyme required for sulfatase activity
LRPLAAALLLAAMGCRRDRPADDRVLVAGASFQMGCDPARDPSCADTEQPAHRVTVAGFRIDRTEVTERAWAACVAAGSCARPAAGFDPERTPLRPVTFVGWADAAAYCRFRGARLPSEAEWELAARGTDGRIYPWGDAAPTCELAHTRRCGETPADVGGRPGGASPLGALDMAGNVDEWVADAYAPYGGGPSDGSQRVARGGAYDAWHSRSTARNALAPGYRDGWLGFRCAKSD